LSKPLTHRVLEAISKNPGLSVKELSEILGVNVEKARGLLYKLKSSGLIEKAGRGYVLTERGTKFLEYLEKSKRTAITGEKETPVEEHLEARGEAISERVVGVSGAESAGKVLEGGLSEVSVDQLKSKLEELEKRVEVLERAVRDLERAVQAKQRKPENLALEEPIMFFNDAVNKYGQAYVEKLISEGRVKRIGMLIVDTVFYSEFRSKFPIRVQDADKLSHHERLLLDEMRREAMVVLFAGREYRLVET
jgi:Mn-dependent DtxR family transcriptional regulator